MMSGRCDSCGEVGDVWCGACLGPHPRDAVAIRERLRVDVADLTAQLAASTARETALREAVQEAGVLLDFEVNLGDPKRTPVLREVVRQLTAALDA